MFCPPALILFIDGHKERVFRGSASENALTASAPITVMPLSAARNQNIQDAGCSTQLAYVCDRVMARPYFLPPLHVPLAFGVLSLMDLR